MTHEETFRCADYLVALHRRKFGENFPIFAKWRIAGDCLMVRVCDASRQTSCVLVHPEDGIRAIRVGVRWRDAAIKENPPNL